MASQGFSPVFWSGHWSWEHISHHGAMLMGCDEDPQDEVVTKTHDEDAAQGPPKVSEVHQDAGGCAFEEKRE